MKNILKKIQRKTENIKRFGIIYEWDNLLLKFGVIKNRSLKSIQEIENFFRALKKEQYPEYLKEWYQKEDFHCHKTSSLSDEIKRGCGKVFSGRTETIKNGLCRLLSYAYVV